jgi:hypothetical protein
MNIMPSKGHLNRVVNKGEDDAIMWKHVAHFVRTDGEQTPGDSIYKVGNTVEGTK